jgi:hypothetical protein
MSATPSPLPSLQPRRRNLRWVWFFAVLAVLAFFAVLIPIIYNLSLQLKPEQLADARRRWAEHGTGDYDLVYETRTTPPGEREPVAQEIEVRVRGGKVVRCVVDGTVLLSDDPQALPALRDFREHTVEGLFDRIDKRLKQDAERTDRRNYATASFDTVDGHVTHYVHRIAGSREREEWTVRLTRR